MLPDLRFLICGVLFCLLLFAVTGAGVRLPDARTRIGEMPEVGRPMMQRSMVEAPVQAQFYMMTAAHRADELERPSEQPAPVEAAPAPARPEPAKLETEAERELPTPAVTATPSPDGTAAESVMAEDAEAPIPASRAEIARQDSPEEAAGPRIAALEPSPTDGGPSAADGGEPPPRLANVPLPQRRPAFFGFRRRAHLLHRRHRIVVVVVSDTPAAGVPAPGASGQPAPAPGAVVQGWPAAGAAAGATATESARRQ